MINVARLVALAVPCAAFVRQPFSLTKAPAWAPRLLLASGAGKGSGGAAKDTSNLTSNPSNSGLGNPVNQFEYAVRKLTGNENYVFGDVAKAVSDTVTTGVEGTVRDVMRDPTYKFGDLTKGAVDQLTAEVEGTVRKVTGDENYKFGDYANNIIYGADKVLTSWRDDGINEFTKTFWRDSFTPQQRRDAVLAMFQLGSIAILSFGFVSNCFLGGTFALAWSMASTSTGLSPLSPDQWPNFLQTLQTVRLVVDLPMLPARVLLAVFLTPHYRKAVVALQKQLPWKQKKPVLNRVMALGLSFAVANGLAVALCTALFVRLGCLLTGTPLLPAIQLQS